MLSLPIQQLNNLSTEDAESLRLVSINNKITKIWQSMNIELTHFLIKLCPRMEHFEVHWIKDTDLLELVRFILMKCTTHIPHLQSLRLNVRNERDEIIDDLQNIIDSEKLLTNYTIKRWGNDITLQWKL